MRRQRPRLAIAAALLAGVLLEGQGTPPGAPLILLTREGRRPVPTMIQSGQELVALDDIAGLFQVVVREDTLAGGVTVSYKGRTVVASVDQPMASVSGRLVALPSPAVRIGNRWLVPVEFLSRALGPIYDARIELRRPSRLLIVGDLRVPRVTARIDAAGPSTRVVVDVTPASEVTTAQEPGRLVLRVGADALDARLPVSGGGLVEAVRPGEQPATMWVVLRDGGTVNTSTVVSESGTRVTIEVAAPGAPATPPATPALPPPPAAIPFLTTPRPTLQTIVIDPGHGGEDAGVQGAGGTLEKHVTLEVARRVKALIETRLGIRVLLTRDDDVRVAIDERASLANNSKADLFISLHANAAFVPSISGAEVFYLALDEQMEAARRAAQAESVALPVVGGGARAIDVVRWDMAQARHVESSAVLARLLEEELRARVPVGPRPLQRAPLRVLVGTNMPAVLVEMTYLTNPAHAERARSVEFQTAVSQAVYETVLRFRAHLENAR
ncbi:MAG: N-acetylmuramoyl-L-alanine amidase [Vicinamibacterales bacterium]